MRNARFVPFALVALAVTVSSVPAQTPSPPKPGPEVAKLGVFIGKWKGEADVKASSMGPAGKMTWTETCEWLEGGFHVVCRSSGEGPTGKMQGLAILGWDAGTGSYTHYGVDSTGWSDLAEGSVADDTWTFGSERVVGDDIVRSRYVARRASPTSFTFTFEMQREGGSWTLVMSGKNDKAP